MAIRRNGPRTPPAGTGTVRQPATPQRTTDEVKIDVPAEPDQSVRDAVNKKAAEKLLGVATEHKDIEGTGQESSAKGDPRVTERRGAIATLIANKSNDLTAQLKALGPNVEQDIKWLMAAERADYKTDGGDEQFDWAKSTMASKSAINTEFKRRVGKQTAAAKGIDNGTLKAFDASSGSVLGLGLIQDDGKRAGALVDTLLQFRARTDMANQEEISNTYGRTNYTGPANTRADLIAPTLVAEQRVLLASADLDASDPAKVKEYALLREVIASHPSSSVNGIFEARNAVGKIFMDGSTGYSATDHATAWIKEEKPPGASASAYKSIHHNFSRDTPKNIEATFQEWVFPLGPKERRGSLFSRLADALNQASSGDGAGARGMLGQLSATDQETVKPLLTKLSTLPDDQVGAAIGTFLKETAKKPLSGDQRPMLEKAIEELKKSYSWSQDNGKAAIGGSQSVVLQQLWSKIKDKPASEMATQVQKYLDANPGEINTGLEANVKMFAALYRSVCADQPDANSLERDIFKAGDAWPQVADAVAQLRLGNDVGGLKELGEARLALRDAIIGSDAGFERHELIKFDADLNRLVNTELGAAVDRVGAMKTDPQRAEGLIAVQTALRSAVASGLHALKDDADPAADKTEGLQVVLADVDKALSDGKIQEHEYRALMSRVYVSVAGTVQNIRSFVDSRAADVATLGAELDPEFLDQFVKQSPLHYATAIAEKGIRAGLEEEIGPRAIKNVEGMRVLNSVGPVVFKDVVIAENTKELVKLQPDKGAMSILYGLEEKKMVAVGGLIVDTDDAPGGNSHLNMYAMNNGITVLALPELRTKYAELFQNAAKEGGLYVTDEGGEFSMMTVDYAVEQGVVKKADLDDLRPGTNRKISYLKSKGLDAGHEQIGYHEAIVSPKRMTREVELFVAMDEVNGIGKKCTSFKELATLGIHARHLAGEKGTVLALLKANPKLDPFVPDGSMVTTGRCRLLLEEAGIKKDWDAIWSNDPTVGTVDDDNFTKSKFYTDPNYRAEKRQHLQDLTKDKLTELLVSKDDQGNKKLTPAGERLYAELMDNPALKSSDNWIARSSFTGEDRPGKSGAGQYESFFHLKDPVSRVEGVIGVMESTWMPEPVENNVADEVNLQHIMPAVVMQHCLQPQHSGVMISRDIEHGTRGQVYYQLVKGFGGGVEGGKTEEGTIRSAGHSVKVQYPGEDGGLVPADALKELRDIVLETETYFNDVVEKGKGYAVDMEVARQDGTWNVVQARVIQLDR